MEGGGASAGREEAGRELSSTAGGERKDLERGRGFSVGDPAGTKREGGKEDPWGGGLHKQ